MVAISRQHRNRQSIGKGSRLRCDRDWRNQLGGWAQPQKIAARAVGKSWIQAKPTQ